MILVVITKIVKVNIPDEFYKDKKNLKYSLYNAIYIYGLINTY